jgi:hypothetical protein
VVQLSVSGLLIKYVALVHNMEHLLIAHSPLFKVTQTSIFTAVSVWDHVIKLKPTPLAVDVLIGKKKAWPFPTRHLLKSAKTLTQLGRRG